MKTTTKPVGVVPQEWRELAQRCLTAMNDVVRFRETGFGRPPEQTCMVEISDLMAMLASAQPATPAHSVAHVGDSQFETWFSEYNPAGLGTKQQMRDAYAEGMGDSAAQAGRPEPATQAMAGQLLTIVREFHGAMSDCGNWPDTTDEREALHTAAIRAKSTLDAIDALHQALVEPARPSCDVLHAHFTPFYLLVNCRRILSGEQLYRENWAIASDLFAVGATTAKRICREAGIDPDGLEVRTETVITKGENQ